MYFYIRKILSIKGYQRKAGGFGIRDELTGAYHTGEVLLEVNRILERKTDARFAVLYIDFENFKYVNDVFGYFVRGRAAQKTTHG